MLDYIDDMIYLVDRNNEPIHSNEEWINSCVYFQFRYSNEKNTYYWSDHHIIEDGKNYYPLRLFRGEDITRGLIINRWDIAEKVWQFMENSYANKRIDYDNPVAKYDEVLRYIERYPDLYASDYTFLPIGEFIEHYAYSFSKLRYVDIDLCLKLSGISKHEPKRMNRF